MKTIILFLLLISISMMMFSQEIGYLATKDSIGKTLILKTTSLDSVCTFLEVNVKPIMEKSDWVQFDGMYVERKEVKGKRYKRLKTKYRKAR